MKGFDHDSGEYLDIDGAKIYYEIKGKEDGPALLLLHGGFGTMEDFNVILEELLLEYKIIGIDSRGQGRSTPGLHELTYERIQEDVLVILKHLNIINLSIIGFSDGGIVAYRLAVLSLLKIDKLVTISSRWNINDALLTEDMFLKSTPESYRSENPGKYTTYQRLNPAPDFDLLTASLVKMWLDPTPSGYLNDKLNMVCCPLLIVHGDDDKLLTRDSVVELSGIIQGAHLLNIPFASHEVFQQQREIFMISLRQFFSS